METTNTPLVLNEHGVYSKEDPGVDVIEFTMPKGMSKHCHAKIFSREVDPGGVFISAYSVSFPEGGSSSPLRVDNLLYSSRLNAQNAAIGFVLESLAEGTTKGSRKMFESIQDQALRLGHPFGEELAPLVRRGTNLELPVRFNQKERNQFAQDLVLKLQERTKLDTQRKNTASMLAAKLKEVEATIELLTTRLATGEENRYVDCEWLLNHPYPGRKTLTRLDTCEIIDEAEMLPGDRQLVLNDIAEHEGKTERSVEEKEVGEITEDTENTDSEFIDEAGEE